MLNRPTLSQQFADNLREAEAASRALVASAASLDALTIQTRAAIAESRRLIDQADALLLR
jgi:hypothetical protein